MKVQATQKGYYGEQLREIGEIFILVPRMETDRRGRPIRKITVEEQFSHEWMERVDGGQTPPMTKKMPDDVLPPPPPPSALKKQPTSMPNVTEIPSDPKAMSEVESPTGSQQVI